MPSPKPPGVRFTKADLYGALQRDLDRMVAKPAAPADPLTGIKQAIARRRNVPKAI